MADFLLNPLINLFSFYQYINYDALNYSSSDPSSASIRFSQQSWIRINQIGYLPDGVKVAVWGGKDTEIPNSFIWWILFRAK